MIPIGRITSYRAYEHLRFAREYVAASGNFQKQSEIRIRYKLFERGRFHAGMGELHNLLSHLDLDEQRNFMREYPRLVELINEYGIIEDLRTFPHGWRPNAIHRNI